MTGWVVTSEKSNNVKVGRVLNSFKLQDLQLLNGHPTAQIQDFYPYNLPLSIKIENYAWLYLLGFNNG